MASKTKLTAALPDGTTATRTTARAYSHVIAVRFDLDQLQRDHEERARTLQEYADDPQCNWTQEEVDSALARGLAEIAVLSEQPWTAYAWAGRRDLAEKRADEAWAIPALAEVRVLPVG